MYVNGNSLVLVDDIEEGRAGWNLGAFPATPPNDPADILTANVVGAGTVTSGGPAVLVYSAIPGNQNNPLAVDTAGSVPAPGAAHAIELVDSVDGTPDISIPAGTDGSDLFVAQTGTSADVNLTPYGPDGVQATTQAFPQVENMIDHICDFWSLLSPVVTGNTGVVSPNQPFGEEHNRDWYEENMGQAADQLAFRTFDGQGNLAAGSVTNYTEGHNVANTYEDALAYANAQMDGIVRYVAVSYNEGVEADCDTVFDANENFLVVFADTDGDGQADTAVRLLGRDNVLHDFHYQDIVSYA